MKMGANPTLDLATCQLVDAFRSACGKDRNRVAEMKGGRHDP